ncbi:hypothetical protein amrb99_61980 [Actinomadura sp. RB99]|uniref:hypothetical protein n=1 Tax=Actinomadura sp. RB99 TaxID=2691577 RepID=UPI00168288B1|nr:hypothetical protein [Actinomadura sp. RB99]MBD2897239.1 hypothetical protein [Actinomadura sp. RB99]
MAYEPTHRVAFSAAALTDSQRDGLACVNCGADLTTGIASVPVATVDGGQVFACSTHTFPAAVGKSSTWPGGEPASVRGAEIDVEEHERFVRFAEDVVDLSRRGPYAEQLAEQLRGEGHQAAADAVTEAAAACNALRSVLDERRGPDALGSALETVHAAMSRAVSAVRAARTAEDGRK